jgi:hypothetical protein
MTQSLERAILGVFRAHGLEDFGVVGAICGGSLDMGFKPATVQVSNCSRSALRARGNFSHLRLIFVKATPADSLLRANDLTS